MILAPFLMKLITKNKLELALPLYMIGYDPDTTSGFIVNYIFQFLITCNAVFVYGWNECLVVLFMGSLATQIEVFRSKVRQLELPILMKADFKEIKRKFNEIIIEHNEILEYGTGVEKLLSCESCLFVFIFFYKMTNPFLSSAVS